MKKWLFLFALGLLIGLSATALFTVRQGEVGIVTRFGRPLPALAEPGLHLKAPWPVDAVLHLDRRLLIFDNEPAEMLTRDKKNVLVDSFLCWRIENPLLFAQTVKTRLEAEARLLDLLTSELGAVVGAEPMESFVNPDPAKVRIREVARLAQREVDLVARENFGIAVVDVAINRFNLPRQNRKSVIERMRAERSRIATAYRSEGEEEAMKIEAQSTTEAEKILAEARSEAEALRGAGEAEALRILADAYRQDPVFYKFLRSLEGYERILDENTTIFLDSDSELLDTFHGRR